MSSCWLVKIAAWSWLRQRKTAKKNSYVITKYTVADTEKECIFMIINMFRNRPIQCSSTTDMHCDREGYAAGGAVSVGTALQTGRSRVQFPVVSLEFFIDTILTTALWPWGSGFGALEVACWSLVPKFAGSNPADAVGFFRTKKSSARLPSEGK